ncbi:MAG: hypothetical protein NTY11_01770 [Candidatus Parcubacteria bacterium]|nr:hypothetical protein [Candidatus Parcubacteria bacterium]
MRTVGIEELWPCALYAINTALANTRETVRQLGLLGVDAFHLGSEMTSLWLEIGGKTDDLYTFLPPWVEKSEDDGDKLVIVDGLHRVMEARLEGLETVTIILVQNTAVPLICYPVEWEEVRLLDAVPPKDQKRRYRYSSDDEMFRWILEHPDRFSRGFNIPNGEDPRRMVANYVREKRGR